jgi:hypothetical protein
MTMRETHANGHAHTQAHDPNTPIDSLSNGLDVAEGSLACADGDQSQRLVDAAERGNINSLSRRVTMRERDEVAMDSERGACLVGD